MPIEYDEISELNKVFLLIRKRKKLLIYHTENNKLINQKEYKKIAISKIGDINGFRLFETQNKFGQTVYVGENGIEFFSN